MSDQERQEDNQPEQQQPDTQAVVPLPPYTQALIQAAQELARLGKEFVFKPCFSGENWVLDLLDDEENPHRMRDQLGVRRGTFIILVKALRELGFQSSDHISIEEQLSIFLYTAVTGLASSHVAERFRRSSSRITKCFERILQALATPPFYTTYVQPPDANSPTPPEILNSPEFHPFFDHALGAIGGTHFRCIPSTRDRAPTSTCQGVLTQNCIAACSFDLRFTYFLSGWEGSMADLTLFNDAHQTDLPIPRGKYYLADAGFATSDALLVPYQNVHYPEWNEAYDIPENYKELFNLRHSSARIVIERIFGILKQRFRILQCPPKYDPSIQALIPPALAALHNFIRHFDPKEIHAYDNEVIDPLIGQPDTARALGIGPDERHRSYKRRGRIAGEMWEQYREDHAMDTD